MSEAPPAVPADGAAAPAAAAPVAAAVNGDAPAATPANDEEKVMADSGVSATVSVSLHPLVIMNISEHWTRSEFCHLSSYIQFNCLGPRPRRADRCQFMEL